MVRSFFFSTLPTETKRERQREREREKERETERQTDERQRERERESERERHREEEGERQTDIQKDRQTDREREKEREVEKERQRGQTWAKSSASPIKYSRCAARSGFTCVRGDRVGMNDLRGFKDSCLKVGRNERLARFQGLLPESR